jgi:membrane associated rhomboid family serine protease
MKRPARAPLPPATLALSATIAAVYGVELSGNSLAICGRFGFLAANPTLGTALSALFVHDPGSLWHVGGNLAVLVLIGSRVEQTIGSTRFAALFLAGGLAGAGLHLVVDPSSLSPLVGCSGSLFAILAVGATLFGPGMLAFVAVLALTNIAHAFIGGGGEVSFGAHLGGLFVGFLFVALARLRGVELHRRARRAGALAPV